MGGGGVFRVGARETKQGCDREKGPTCWFGRNGVWGTHQNWGFMGKLLSPEQKDSG